MIPYILRIYPGALWQHRDFQNHNGPCPRPVQGVQGREAIPPDILDSPPPVAVEELVTGTHPIGGSQLKRDRVVNRTPIIFSHVQNENRGV